MYSGVWVLGPGFWGMGYGYRAAGFGVWDEKTGIRVRVWGTRHWGTNAGVQYTGFRLFVLGSVIRHSILGYETQVRRRGIGKWTLRFWTFLGIVYDNLDCAIHILGYDWGMLSAGITMDYVFWVTVVEQYCASPPPAPPAPPAPPHKMIRHAAIQ